MSKGLLLSFNGEVYQPEYYRLVASEVFAIGCTVLSAMMLQERIHTHIYRVSSGNGLILDTEKLESMLKE